MKRILALLIPLLLLAALIPAHAQPAEGFPVSREAILSSLYEADIATLENNIGFFATSKGAESLMADVRSKIAKAKEEMAETIKKVQAIDAAENSAE